MISALVRSTLWNAGISKMLLSAQPCRNELVRKCLKVFLRTDHQDNQEHPKGFYKDQIQKAHEKISEFCCEAWGWGHTWDTWTWAFDHRRFCLLSIVLWWAEGQRQLCRSAADTKWWKIFQKSVSHSWVLQKFSPRINIWPLNWLKTWPTKRD